MELVYGVIWIAAGIAGWYFFGIHIHEDDIKDAVFLLCVMLEVAGISKVLQLMKKPKQK